MRALPLLGTALLLAGGLVARAQEPDAEFLDTTEVLVVNVDVTVSDRQGRPILGLGPEDFSVTEDGEPVEISHFAVVDQRKREEAEAAVPDDLPEATSDDGAAPRKPAEEGLDLFVYVDNFNLLANRRDRVLDALEEHLDRTLRPADRVTLIVHNGGQIAFLTRRSSSREEIVGAVDSIRGMDGGGIDDRVLQQQTVRGIQDVFELYEGDVCNEAEGALLSVVSAYADAVSQHARASIHGLETLVRVLAAVEGRKPVLHVTNGFPGQPGLGMFAYLEDLCGGGRFLSQANAYDETDRLAALASRANANRVTFFPLQASGVPGLSDFRAGTSMMMRQNLQHPLEVMAEETGGKTTFHTSDFEGTLRALEDELRVYYSIGYRPRSEAGSEEAEDRRIEVRLAREIPGARVRFRHRYSLKSSDERLAERTLGALHGFEDNPLGIRLGLGVLEEESPPRVVLAVAMPRDRLTYVPRDGRWECAIDLAIGHVGEDGSETRQRRITLTAERDGDRPPDGVETIRVAMAAKPGSNRFAVGVVDVVSSRIATAAGTVEVAAGTR